MRVLWLTGSIVLILLIVGGAAYWFFSSPQPVVPEPTPMRSLSAPTREVPQGFAEYKSLRYGVSVLYSTALTAEKKEEVGGAQTVTILDPAATSQEDVHGVQIYLASYVVPEIDEAFVRRYLPSAHTFEPIIVHGAKGLAFISNDPQFGELREVWFVNNKGLYEATAPRAQEQLLLDILNTWVFF